MQNLRGKITGAKILPRTREKYPFTIIDSKIILRRKENCETMNPFVTSNFLITGIWLANKPHKHVSHVMVHEVVNETIHRGERITRQRAVDLLKLKSSMRTATWNYKTANWNIGEPVSVENVDGIDYLVTRPDAGHLINLIRMLVFPTEKI